MFVSMEQRERELEIESYILIEVINNVIEDIALKINIESELVTCLVSVFVMFFLKTTQKIWMEYIRNEIKQREDLQKIYKQAKEANK
jgi:uncharacterized protein YajQ (UPF0234 family)